MFNASKQLFIYKMHNFYHIFQFDASNSPKTALFSNDTQSSVWLFLDLASLKYPIGQLMVLYIGWPNLDEERIGRGMPSGLETELFIEESTGPEPWVRRFTFNTIAERHWGKVWWPGISTHMPAISSISSLT